MEHKRLTLFAGHYGSGKTNIAVNYALLLAKEGNKVTVADLDIVNPYFRTKDSEKELSEAGIRLISPRFANSNVDLPALPAESYRLVQDKSEMGVMDIGGDDRGAYALGRYRDAILEENNYRMAFVVNFHRPLTSCVDDAIEVMREIEAAAGIRFTCIVNNSNIGEETTKEIFLNSLPLVEELSERTGLPVWLHTVKESLFSELSDREKLMPLVLQKKIFDLPKGLA